jgi:hypothetical protein
MRSALAGLAAAAVLVGVPSADAAQRYASPAGSGSACTQAAPCSLQEAIGSVASNDEVIVTPGSYELKTRIEPPIGVSNIYVHGDLSAPMPHIAASLIGVPFSFTEGTGIRLSYLEIVNEAEDAWGATCGTGGSIDRVRILVSGELARGVFFGAGCKVHDSLLRAEGNSSIALQATAGIGNETAVTRNVTAIASGPESVGILASYNGIFPGGSMTLDLKNAIASGGGSDLAANGFMGTATIVVTNSNFDSAKPNAEATITGGPNQTAAPLFVNAAAGDYREAPGSPTIDAGSTDQIGPLDLEGNPRNQGPAPDIGAFEFASPAPTVGVIESLSVSPKSFRVVNAGGAIVSRRHKSKAPVGATVRLALSKAGTVDFRVEQAIKGRRVGKKCEKRSSNRDHAKCTFFSMRKGGFSDDGATGQSGFKFSGRLGGKALRPGSYRLVASMGDSVKRARFQIVP